VWIVIHRQSPDLANGLDLPWPLRPEAQLLSLFRPANRFATATQERETFSNFPGMSGRDYSSQTAEPCRALKIHGTLIVDPRVPCLSAVLRELFDEWATG
jgi:hypothetical protein